MNFRTCKRQLNGRGFPAYSDKILIRRSHGELQTKYSFQIQRICHDQNSCRLVQNTVASLLTLEITRQMTALLENVCARSNIWAFQKIPSCSRR